MGRMIFSLTAFAVFLQVYMTLIPVSGGTFDATEFLRHNGYLQISRDHGKNNEVSPSILREAIKSFQEFSRLPVTGKLDAETLKNMKIPRCGNPDKIPFGVLQPARYFWQKKVLTWKITKMSTKLKPAVQQKAMKKAFRVWAKTLPLSIKPVNSKADIEIMFVRGDHGCGPEGIFGNGKQLAHAYGPGLGKGGDIHFDDDQTWAVGRGAGIDLVAMAVHQIGHALGLEHSNASKTVMAPIYGFKRVKRPRLFPDDIKEIQKLYSEKNLNVPKYCENSFSLDAFAQGGYGLMYAFREDTVYLIGLPGLLGDPKKITAVFPGGPEKGIAAASYSPQNKRFYIFNNDVRVWRFSHLSSRDETDALFKLDSGYPKLVTQNRRLRPSAALTLKIKKGEFELFFFAGKKLKHMWTWDINNERIVRPPKLKGRKKKFFRKAPKRPDAAFMNQKGHAIFFMKNKYIFVEKSGKKSKKLPIGTALFGAACWGTPTIIHHGDF